MSSGPQISLQLQEAMNLAEAVAMSRLDEARRSIKRKIEEAAEGLPCSMSCAAVVLPWHQSQASGSNDTVAAAGAADPKPAAEEIRSLAMAVDEFIATEMEAWQAAKVEVHASLGLQPEE